MRLWGGKDWFRSGEHTKERNLKQREKKLHPWGVGVTAKAIGWKQQWKTGRLLTRGDNFSNPPCAACAKTLHAEWLAEFFLQSKEADTVIPFYRWGNGCSERLTIKPVCHEVAKPRIQSWVVLLSKVQVQATCLTLHLGENNTQSRRRPRLAQEKLLGNSLAFQWLGLGTFTVRAQVLSLVRELRSHKPWDLFFFLAWKKKNAAWLLNFPELKKSRPITQWARDAQSEAHPSASAWCPCHLGWLSAVSSSRLSLKLSHRCLRHRQMMRCLIFLLTVRPQVWWPEQKPQYRLMRKQTQAQL